MKATPTVFAILSCLSGTSLAAPSANPDDYTFGAPLDRWMATFWSDLDCHGANIPIIANGSGVLQATPGCMKNIFPITRPYEPSYATSYSFQGNVGKRCRAAFHYGSECAGKPEFEFHDEDLNCMNAPGGEIKSFRVHCAP